ncbi:unnamed protein product, partial [Amoebophrya sp. A25]
QQDKLEQVVAAGASTSASTRGGLPSASTQGGRRSAGPKGTRERRRSRTPRGARTAGEQPLASNLNAATKKSFRERFIGTVGEDSSKVKG